MERKERIRNAYRLTGSNNFYDGMITCSTIPGKAVCKLVWDMNAEDCAEYQTRALSGIPDEFSGRLLEVPVGTGVLTVPIYKTIPHAHITCLDYSPDMMAQASAKAKHMGVRNISFRQGDVGALPFEDSSFDIVLSLNGFHAFPDKAAAFRETFRVLKSGGVFCGCFYVMGNCKRTDRLIRRLYQPLKFFTPPYETMDSLSMRLKSMYSQVDLSHIKSIACFVCRKGRDAKERYLSS
ncbi:MAG TPA: class I SAM-dependent methyltransferase, partial [Clostridiales bacterium]|nr:class I SAM-dependent methyltransferase [Clostridiales bacterium]